MSIKEIKPWAETDKAARDLLNSGLTRQEVTYLMTFMQAHVLLQFQENMN